MNEREIYIIADDFTGSADAASYFGRVGLQVRVSLDLEHPWDYTCDTQVVQVFDTESREIEIERAVDRIHAAGRNLADHNRIHAAWYKKVDSTMRGHVGAEISALLRSSGRNIALLAPAFPANRRTVRDGRLLINDVPVSQTEFANDPHYPILQDDVAAIVQQTTNLPVVRMERSLVDEGTVAIERFIKAIGGAKRIIVADAETDEELEMIARAIANHPLVLPCGSAGLARQLALIWGHQDTCRRAETESYVLPHCEQILIAVGSANPIATGQLTHVLAKYGAPCVVISPSLLADPQTRLAEIERAKHEISQTNTAIAAITYSNERVQRSNCVPGTFDHDLATVVRHYLCATRKDSDRSIGLIATGGDTAYALCEALCARVFWPQGDIEPGMPWSLLNTDLGTFPIVSKAGGFGGVDALYTAVTFLLRGVSSSQI